MKKSIIWAMLAMLLPITQAWAHGGPHYGKAEIYVGTGSGSVYLAKSSSAKTADAAPYTWKCAGDNDNGSGDKNPYYFFAVPADNYGFTGWSTTSGGTIESTSNPYKPEGKATGTSSSSPTVVKYYANFALQHIYNAHLTCVAVSSEPIPSGVCEVSIGTGSYGASAEDNGQSDKTTAAYADVAFQVHAKSNNAEWEFVRWVNASDAELSTNADFTHKVRSDKEGSATASETIKAVFAKKYTYYGKIMASSSGDGSVALSRSDDSSGLAFKKNDELLDSRAVADVNTVFTYYAFAKADDPWTDFVGWYQGDKQKSIKPTYKVSVTATAKEESEATTTSLTAKFETAPVVSTTFQQDENGSYMISATDGATLSIDATNIVAGTGTGVLKLPHAMTVTLSNPVAEDGYRFVRWWKLDAAGNQVELSQETSVTRTFESDVSIGAEFVQDGRCFRIGEQTYDTLSEAIGSIEGTTATVIEQFYNATLGTCEIPSHVTLYVPAKWQLTIDSTATVNVAGVLKVAGKLANNGALSGTGVIALNYATATQSSTINVPYPYGTDGIEGTGTMSDGVDGTAGKYVKTTVAAVNADTQYALGTVADTLVKQWFVTVVNGDGEVFTSKPNASTPKAVLCTVNRKTALNWVRGVVQSDKNAYSSVDSAFDACGFPNSGEGKFIDTDKMVILLESVSDLYSSDSSGTLYKQFSLDLADHTISFNPKQFGGTGIMRYFNGSVTIALRGDKIMKTHMYFYNCSKVSLPKISYNYPTRVLLYDSCSNFSISSYESGSNVDAGIYYFGSDKHSGSFKDVTLGNANLTKVYWGKFSKDPTKFLADPRHFKVSCVNSEYVIEKKSPDPNVKPAKIGTVEYDSVAKALDVAKNGETVVLTQDFEMESDLEISAATRAVLNLDGWSILGSGSIVNNGCLDIVDESGCVTPSQVDVAIENVSGELGLSQAAFNGAITLYGGKCWFLDGTFNGLIGFGPDVELPADVAEVGGGLYARTTYTFKGETRSLIALNPNRSYKASDVGRGYYIAKNPVACLKSTNPFKAVAFDSDTEGLYNSAKSSTKRSAYIDRSRWLQAVELMQTISTFSRWGIDCTMVFDRTVEKGTASGSALSKTLPLKKTVDPNVATSMLLSNMALDPPARGTTAPIQYSAFLPGGEHDDDISFTVSSEPVNYGTTYAVQMRLTRDVRWQHYPYDYWYEMSGAPVIVEARQVFGAGSNKAMIRPATGAATFYGNLPAAVGALGSGNDTVMLCNDCGDNVTISKACKIDLNGFNYTGTITLENGLVTNVTTSASGTTVYEAVANERILTVQMPEHATLVSVTANGEPLTVDGEGKCAVPDGAKVVITYSADDGYEVSTVTINSMTEDMTADAPTITAKSYAIAYELNGGTIDADANPTTYTIEKSDITLANPTKEGYDFLGWFDENDNLVEGIAQGSTGDLTLTAKWSPVPIQFKPANDLTKVVVTTNGVEVLPDDDGNYTVLYGQSVRITFEASRGYSVGSEEIVIDSMTYTVTWPTVTPNQYTIKYELDDDVVNQKNPSGYTYPSSIKLYAPTREGHTFLGWYYDEGLTEKVQGTFVDGDETGTFIPGGAADNLTLYAKWEKAPVALTIAMLENAHVKIVSVLANDVVIDSVGGAYAIPQIKPQTVVITYAADAGYGLTVDQTTATIENIQTNTEVTAPVAVLEEYDIGYVLYDGTKGDGTYPDKYSYTSADIVLPAPTKDGYDFGGWYEDAAFTKKVGKTTIPAGSTGNKTFYACWLKEVKTVDSQDAGLADTMIKVKVPDSVSADKLQETADNGLKTWQNFARDAAGVSGDGTTITVEPKSSASASEVTVNVVTAESVAKVAVVQVSSVTNATVLSVVGQAETQTDGSGNQKTASLEVDYAEQPAGVYRPAVEITDAGGGKALIPDVEAPAVEVVKKTDEAKATVVTVPFAKDVSGNPLTIATLIDSSSLSDGDTIKKYNKTTGQYDAWAVQDGALTPISTIGTAQTEPDAAADTTLEAGQVLIVERASADTTDKPITMVGQYTDNVVTPIEQPTVSSQEPEPDPVWNLVSNIDTQKKFDLNAIETANADDMVVVLTSDATRPQKRYRRNKQGKWSYTTNVVEEVELFGGTKIKTVKAVEVTDDADIKGGGWFWYVSGGGDKDTKIDWKKK